MIDVFDEDDPRLSDMDDLLEVTPERRTRAVLDTCSAARNRQVLTREATHQQVDVGEFARVDLRDISVASSARPVPLKNPSRVFFKLDLIDDAALQARALERALHAQIKPAHAAE